MSLTRAWHNPLTNPCHCGLPPNAHHPSHAPKPGCCLAPETNHKGPRQHWYPIGIDGEGLGRTPHRYTLLAYSDATSRVCNHIEDESLSTTRCLNFLLSTPIRARIFSYAFVYDLTKILADLDDRSIYYLFRPDFRQRPKSYKGKNKDPIPVQWGDYLLNMVGRKFVVQRGKQRRVIWDIFAFYQSKFVVALEDWKAAPQAEIDRISEMKDKRSVLDTQSPEDIRNYCYSECASLAVLARKLIDAHESAGLTLRAYHGAGSTASAMLKKHGIGELNRATPTEMLTAVASAFFGGRFENAWSGICGGPVYNHDISSAYPYQICQLPCLDCGQWTWTDDETDLLGSSAACVKFSLSPIGNSESWGPLPFRTDKGSIVYPSAIGEGWVWSAEFRSAKKIFRDKVCFRGAWVYNTQCNHRPYDFLPEYYNQRLRIGKEGPGKVYKLGPNSVYGKNAQSLGVDPPFQCWIWAGITTSATRAMLLDVLALHQDRANMLMVATDGIQTREYLQMPTPIDTGTGTTRDKETGTFKPLGGWESKDIPQGIFLARPGIYFPLSPTEKDVKKVRARGVGRANLFKHWQAVIAAHANGNPDITIANVSRFHGAKSSIHRLVDKATGIETFVRSDKYGEWSDDYPCKISFSPLPKRAAICPNGFMPLRAFPNDVSTPYKKALLSDEAEAEIAARAILDEQPDADMTEIE